MNIPSPKDMLESHAETIQPKVEELITHCIESLKTSWDGATDVWVAVSQKPNVIKAAISQMTAAGWSVEYHSEQRDGQALIFKAYPVTPKSYDGGYRD